MPSTARHRSSADRLDAVFGALTDRTRRGMLARLAQGPATVTELAEPFDISLPAISRHLKVLERARLIERRVDGRVHHCRLDVAALREADIWLQHYRDFWEGTLEALARHVEDAPPTHHRKRSRT
jgi:DNA-binding transcriptional ArsR family regulator